jgi:tRNA (guanine-N7-)-methyltransferase
MGQKKLLRFAELNTFPNVLQYPKDIAGKWNEHFKNNNSITLELACGKGEYAVGLGQLFPKRNFIGIDLKGNRIWVGAKKALQNNLNNVSFLRAEIDQLTEYFAQDEIAEIWITFPDPQLRRSKAKKRLTHPKFLRLYQQILLPGGLIHLKTDSPDLYHFTKLVIELYGCMIKKDSDNIYKEETIADELKIKTHYESLDIAGSNKIHYLCFSLPANFPGKEKDDELKQLLKEPAYLQAGMKELIENIDYYFNGDGLIVLTEKYHLDKGYCCGNGCKHCPYQYENVPEPLKSELIMQKESFKK